MTSVLDLSSARRRAGGAGSRVAAGFLVAAALSAAPGCRIHEAPRLVRVENVERPAAGSGAAASASVAAVPGRAAEALAASALPRPLGTPYHDLRRHTHRSIGEDLGIDLSPDGRLLLYSSTFESELPKVYLKEDRSPLVRSITVGPFRDIHPKFSPDGRWIAFASDREGSFDIWLVPADRPTAFEQLTVSPEDELHPSFSPDGGRIAFCRFSPRHGWNLWIRGRDEHVLVELGPGLFPEWSPTGEWIAFQRPSQREPRWHAVWIIRPDGTDVRQVVALDDRGAIQPTWSPEGDRLAFTTSVRARGEPDRETPLGGGDSTARGEEIGIIELRRGRIFQLTRNGGSNGSPAWSLDGRIYFTSDRYGGRDVLSLIPPEVDET